MEYDDYKSDTMQTASDHQTDKQHPLLALPPGDGTAIPPSIGMYCLQAFIASLREVCFDSSSAGCVHVETTVRCSQSVIVCGYLTENPGQPPPTPISPSLYELHHLTLGLQSVQLSSDINGEERELSPRT